MGHTDCNSASMVRKMNVHNLENPCILSIIVSWGVLHWKIRVPTPVTLGDTVDMRAQSDRETMKTLKSELWISLIRGEINIDIG